MSRAIVIDFETESLTDLKKLGAYAYSVDPSTDAMCLAWQDADDWHPSLWTPDEHDCPTELVDAIAGGAIVWAFNAFFEKSIWRNVMVPRYGWPDVPDNQWACLAARAAYYGYSQNLDRCAAGVSLDVSKDTVGHRVMMQLCNPKKRSKKTIADYAVNLEILYEYCKKDVQVEMDLYQQLPELPDTERKNWLLDQEINQLGIPFDVELVKAAVDCAAQINKNARNLLPRITDGAVSTPNQVAKILEFCKSRGVYLANLQADTVDQLVDRKTLPDDVRQVLKIRKQAGTAAIKKFARAQQQLVDGRIRGGFVYYGAHTGRWTGKGVQPTNMPRMHFKGEEETEEAIRAIKSRDLGEVARLDKANPTDVLTKSVRPSITAEMGKTLVCGDFAGIELRVLTWLVGDQDSLDRIVEHGSGQLYLDMAEAIFDRKVSKSDTYEYTAGKSARLGLGYQMGAGRYVDMAAGYGIKIPPELAEKVVRVYRNKNPLVTDAWNAVKKCVTNTLTDGFPTKWRNILFRYNPEYKALVITLPSKRELWYPGAHLDEDEKGYETIFYYGDKMGKWLKQKLYGGLLIENIVQAIARDLLCYSMRSLGKDYDVVSHCYDEIVIEVLKKLAEQCVKDMTKAMTTPPQWAAGLPLGVDLWTGKRYRK